MVSGVLHHIGYGAADRRWTLLAGALAAGDVVVLLDHAARDAPACAQRIATLVPGVRCCLPAVEYGLCSSTEIEIISDAHWWRLIASHEVLLEWS
ncbi:MAG: hypothetical protein DYH17_06030 [Xanthomonadales bacterium PRO6]|nr:hypothetical protein [Xanthomonadales bacterium]MCE7930915.1 hypothetical protein [Xanthomonadales bacterium PRO6]